MGLPMTNTPDTDDPPMARKHLNIRQTTFDILDEYREVLDTDEQGGPVKESWDRFLRRVVRDGHLKKPRG